MRALNFKKIGAKYIKHIKNHTANTSQQLSLYQDLKKLPNIISISRIFGVIAAVMLFIYGHPKVGLILGATSGLTDYLDGYIARKTNQLTTLGELLDQMSDLIFALCGFMLGIYFHLISPWLFILYILREVTIITTRSFASLHGVQIPSTILGKVKTNIIGYSFFFIYLSISETLPTQEYHQYALLLGTVGIWCGVGCGWISGYQYLKEFAKIYSQYSKPH